MVETSDAQTQANPRFLVHLTHADASRRRHWTLCERPIGLGDNAVIPYDVVAESQLGTVDCPTCLELAGRRARRWRSPRRPPTP